MQVFADLFVIVSAYTKIMNEEPHFTVSQLIFQEFEINDFDDHLFFK
jgi:hypothetical protein